MTTAAASSATTRGSCSATRSSIWTAEPARRRHDHAADPGLPATFDQQDRYDADGDGNFNEPDGFIDHFQIVHAGGDQAAGDPTYGSRRHLEPPLVRLAARAVARAASPGVNIGSGGASGGQTLPEQPDRRLGRRLHHPAGERRPRCLRARVRPRPRPARPLRHLRQHRWRGEQHGVLDPDVLRRQHRRRRPRRHRRQPDRPRRLGAVPARLARPAGHQGTVLRRRLRRPGARRHTPRARTSRPRRRPPGALRAAAGQAPGRPNVGDPFAGTQFFYCGSGQRPRQHDDEDDRDHRAARSRPRCATSIEDGLGLRVPRGLDRRRGHLDRR